MLRRPPRHPPLRRSSERSADDEAKRLKRNAKQSDYRQRKSAKRFEVRLILHESHAKKLARVNYCSHDDAVEHNRKAIAAALITMVELFRE